MCLVLGVWHETVPVLRELPEETDKKIVIVTCTITAVIVTLRSRDEGCPIMFS